MCKIHVIKIMTGVEMCVRAGDKLVSHMIGENKEKRLRKEKET